MQSDSVARAEKAISSEKCCVYERVLAVLLSYSVEPVCSSFLEQLYCYIYCGFSFALQAIMTRVLVTGDSMVKYQSQYLVSRGDVCIKVKSFPGIRTEQLFERISESVAESDVVIIHVGTNNTRDSVNVCMDKYRRLLSDLRATKRNAVFAFSAILPRERSGYPCQQRSSTVEHPYSLNVKYRAVNSLLQELCHAEGVHFIEGQVEWEQLLCKDGVHLNFKGNEVVDVMKGYVSSALQEDHLLPRCLLASSMADSLRSSRNSELPRRRIP